MSGSAGAWGRGNAAFLGFGRPHPRLPHAALRATITLMERLQPSLWVPGPWSPTAPFQKSRTRMVWRRESTFSLLGREKVFGHEKSNRSANTTKWATSLTLQHSMVVFQMIVAIGMPCAVGKVNGRRTTVASTAEVVEALQEIAVSATPHVGSAWHQDWKSALVTLSASVAPSKDQRCKTNGNSHHKDQSLLCHRYLLCLFRMLQVRSSFDVPSQGVAPIVSQPEKGCRGGAAEMKEMGHAFTACARLVDARRMNCWSMRPPTASVSSEALGRRQERPHSRSARPVHRAFGRPATLLSHHDQDFTPLCGLSTAFRSCSQPLRWAAMVSDLLKPQNILD